MALNPSPATQLHDLDGLGINASQPGNGFAEALIALVNKADQILANEASDVIACTLTFAAEAANVRDVTLQVIDGQGKNLSGAKRVRIETVGAANQGDIAAPAVITAAGTLDKIQNPATGPNIAYATTDSTGLLTFSVADTATETLGVQATVSGGQPFVTSTTFA